MVENVGVAVGIMSVCCWKLKLGLYIDQQKISDFSVEWKVPLVFLFAPDTGKSYLHAENVRTFGIGPLRNRS